MTQRSGYAYGEQIPAGSGYLTILGSYWKRPELHATREEAQAALGASPARNNPHLNLAVHYVTETPHGGVSGGYAYRITEPL